MKDNVNVDYGLTPEQVAERVEQGLYNKATKKYSKTYRSIFIGNICTFFNLLGLLAAIFLMFAALQTVSQRLHRTSL